MEVHFWGMFKDEHFQWHKANQSPRNPSVDFKSPRCFFIHAKLDAILRA